MTMKNVLIIGAGQLGSRHLQGLTACDEPLSIHLLDPAPESLERARTRFAEMGAAAQRHRLSVATAVAELPHHLDLVISATTADIRLASLRPVLARARVANLLLEKVLFQRLADYDEAAELLAGAKVPTWVNCPRRLFPAYAALRDFFGDDTPTLMQVSGANWGLGCNGVHFCDLFDHLAGDSGLRYDTALLNRVTHPSKRAGFHEFSGTLVGRSATGQLELQCTTAGSGRHLLLIRSAARTALVDEVGATVRLLDDEGRWSEQPFAMPYQSQLTGQVAADLLAGRPVALPSYETSARIHRAFLAPLLAHYNAVNGTQAEACPVT